MAAIPDTRTMHSPTPSPQQPASRLRDLHNLLTEHETMASRLGMHRDNLLTHPVSRERNRSLAGAERSLRRADRIKAKLHRAVARAGQRDR